MARHRTVFETGSFDRAFKVVIRASLTMRPMANLPLKPVVSTISLLSLPRTPANVNDHKLLYPLNTVIPRMFAEG